jgi:hypothetical protein
MKKTTAKTPSAAKKNAAEKKIAKKAAKQAALQKLAKKQAKVAAKNGAAKKPSVIRLTQITNPATKKPVFVRVNRMGAPTDSRLIERFGVKAVKSWTVVEAGSWAEATAAVAAGKGVKESATKKVA